MHISEGILSAPLLIGGFVTAITGTAIGLNKMDQAKVAEVGLLSAVSFIVSIIHIPLGFSNAHLSLSGLLGILLGWTSFPAIVTALIIQAVMFQYGGITTLGINTVAMAVPALFSHYIFSFLVAKTNIKIIFAAFFCGMFSILIGSIIISSCLLLSNSSFREIAILVLLAHIPIMIIEGIVTACSVSFLNKVKPELLVVNLSKNLLK